MPSSPSDLGRQPPRASPAAAAEQNRGWAEAAAATVAVLLLLVVILFAVGKPSHWPPEEVPPHQGEALDAAAAARGRYVHDPDALRRLVREPEDTWSSVAYVGAGAYLLGVGLTPRVRRMGIPLLGLGVGSFLYHASASAALRPLEVGCLYWVYLTLVGGAAAVALRLKTSMFDPKSGPFLGLSLGFAGFLTVARTLSLGPLRPFSIPSATVVAAACTGLLLAFASWRQRMPGLCIQAVAALVLFAAAAVCELGDHPGGFLCNPQSLVQAHALWHGGSALAFLIAALAIERAEVTRR